MRHLLLALLIALLPIRGWVGDAMALSMLTNPANGMAHAEVAQTAPPCHEGVAQAVETAAPHHSDNSAQAESDATHAHCGCEVCNGPSMSLATPAALLPEAVQGPRVPPLERFASFDPQQGIKPPIS